MSELFQGYSAVQNPNRVVISPKRRMILVTLRERQTLTLDDAVELIGRDIYANKKFHVGNVLSAMVKQGLIRRVKPGVFTLPTP